MSHEALYIDVGTIIVAGGRGTRMGNDTPKQFLPLRDKPVLMHTLERIGAALPGSRIVVVLPADQLDRWETLCRRYGVSVPHRNCAGGADRTASVRAGLTALDDGPLPTLIAVHDGVRPLASIELIRRTVECARRHGTAVPCIVPIDSFRQLTAEGSVPVDRARLRAVQTPQIFRADLLKAAYRHTDGAVFTDDATAVENSGFPVTLCEGERTNLKITVADDLRLAEAILTMEKQRNP